MGGHTLGSLSVIIRLEMNIRCNMMDQKRRALGVGWGVNVCHFKETLKFILGESV